MTQPQTITLTVELVNAVLNYLAQRPYGDVHQMIAAVQQQAAEQAKNENQSAPANAA
jgi:hypothetical protein